MKICSMAVLLSWILLAFSVMHVESQQQQDPMTVNGGSVLAMAGKDSVALAVDKRFASGNHVSTTRNIDKASAVLQANNFLFTTE